MCMRMSPLSVYIPSPYIICVYSLPLCISSPYVYSVCVLCWYALSKCPLSVCIYPSAVWVISLCVSRLRQYLSPLRTSPLFVCITPALYLSPVRMGSLFVCITPPGISTPSRSGSSLCAYHISVSIYPLSGWVLSLRVFRLGVYLVSCPPFCAYHLFMRTVMGWRLVLGP